MKRILTTFVFAFGGIARAFSAQTDVKRDMADNTDKTCGGGNSRPGEILFDEFPRTRDCQIGMSGGKWSNQRENLCHGFLSGSTANDSEVRSLNVADVQQGCWKWACKPAYGMYEGGICKTLQEHCTSKNLAYRNGACTGLQWCGNFASGFNPQIHYEVVINNCMEYRCKAGTYFGASKSVCTPCNPVPDKMGGCYVAADGITYGKCMSTQYVYKDPSTGRFSCKEVETVTDGKIKSCWRSLNDGMAAVMDCIKR
jgi:hypothetical protein